MSVNSINIFSCLGGRGRDVLAVSFCLTHQLPMIMGVSFTLLIIGMMRGVVWSEAPLEPAVFSGSVFVFYLGIPLALLVKVDINCHMLYIYA